MRNKWKIFNIAQDYSGMISSLSLAHKNIMQGKGLDINKRNIFQKKYMIKSEVYLEPCETSKVEFFVKKVVFSQWLFLLKLPS